MVSGRTSTRGSASLMKWTAAELLDTAARRGVDGGRGYGEGVAAMAWESEGEELERGGGVWEVRGREGGRFTALAGRGRRRAGAWHPCGARRRAPACLPGRQAARWRGAGLGRQVGPVLGAR